jgi:hypothetical protein
MVDNYRDKGIICGDTTLEIRHYYPWGSKHVPYSTIKGVQRVTLAALKGKARIWGTANVQYWANWDSARMSKTEGLVLDLGKRVKAFITPDDCDAVEAVLRERAHLGPAGPTIPAPFI